MSPSSSTSFSQPFLDTIRNRRTYYALQKSSPIPDSKITDIITQTILHVPSSFNSQSTRIILLVQSEHDALWDIVHSVLQGVVPPENFPVTEKKLAGFKAAYGTVLFFEDRKTVTGMQEKFPLYADKFPIWATQSDGMHQFTIWTALEAEGLGCNLQHYSPLIDAKVAEKWNVPEDWVLNAQLVFGTPAAEPGEKTFLDLGERFKVFGA